MPLSLVAHKGPADIYIYIYIYMYVYIYIYMPGMSSRSFTVIMYIAWYDFRIPYHKNVYRLV